MFKNRKPLELNTDFQYALDQLEKTMNSMFITGKAGTGKSTLLKLFRDTTRKNTVVLAPTGLAALNIHGQTIHSFFRFPGRPLSIKDIKKQRDHKLYKKIDTIIIDEISMVRADLLDQIDNFLRLNRDNWNPFGGVQMVFFGDLFQLPPVVGSEVEANLLNTKYSSPYFFSATVFFEGFPLEMIELRKVYRQESKYFMSLLDAVRYNDYDPDDLEAINHRFLPGFESPEFYITIAARNLTADAINQRALEKIPLPYQEYKATVTGQFQPNQYPTDAVLKLKLDAQVMFIKNDVEGNFVNGTLGKVVKMEKDLVTVMVEDDNGNHKYIETGHVEWEILKYKLNDQGQIDHEVAGSFIQLPLKLAWAITIHKAQGKTFDKVIIDLDKGAFESGQTYVALSRCRALEGIVLRQPILPRDIKTDEKVIDFYRAHFR